MANVIDRQIVEEGHRNVIVKFTGVLDTSDVYERPAIALGDMVNNDPRLVLTGFRVDLVEYSIGNGLEVLLEWNGVTPKQILPLSGRGKINSTNYGGFIPVPAPTGYDGSINLKTTGWTANLSPLNFTIALELVKMYNVS